MNWKKLGGTWGIAFAVGFYTTFVIQRFWNWFAVPALHVPEISYWGLYGLVLGLRLIFEKDDSFLKGEIYGRFELMLNACVQEERREELAEALRSEDKWLPLKMFQMVFGQVVGNTLALAIGFVIHTLAV